MLRAANARNRVRFAVATLVAAAAVVGCRPADPNAGTNGSAGGGDAGVADSIEARADTNVGSTGVGGFTDAGGLQVFLSALTGGGCGADASDAAGAAGAVVDGSAAQLSTSCAGNCGNYVDAAACQCDDFCDNIGDCCSDKVALCGVGSGGGGGFGGFGGVDAGAVDTSAVAGLDAIAPAKPGCGSCPSGQLCDGVQCVTPSCALPGPASLANANVLVDVAIAPASVGCDLDGDGTIDNAIGGPFANSGAGCGAAFSWTAGGSEFPDFVWLPTAWTSGGQSTSLGVVRARKVSSGWMLRAADLDLGANTSVCPWQTSVALTATAGALVGHANSGAPDIAGLHVPASLATAGWSGQLVGGVTWDGTKDGVICGVWQPEEIYGAVLALVAKAGPVIGMDAQSLMAMVLGVIPPDIDTDGDGIADGISGAYTFSTKKATVAGFE